MLNDWAWVGGLFGVMSLGGVAWLAYALGRLNGAMTQSAKEVQKELTTIKAQQQVDLKLQLFMRAAESAEAGTRALIGWAHLATEHATSIVFDKQGEQGFRQTQEQIDGERHRAEQAGLFLPPELDRPYQQALKAVLALEVAATSAKNRSELVDRRELCRPAVVAMDQEMLTFLNAVRVWKKRQWFQATTGEDPAPDLFSDVTDPKFTRPSGLIDRDGEIIS